MSLYAVDWSAKDDLRLMEAMDEFRFGNWEYLCTLPIIPRDISKYVDKPERACVQHYSRCYLRSPSLVPSASLFDSTPYQGSFPVSPFFLDPPAEAAPDPSYRDDWLICRASASSDISGYNPLRDDYDVEFDNDAELMLKDVDILGDEDANEAELKRCVLRTFNRRLEERENRKRFVLERGLVQLKTLFAEEKRKSKVRSGENAF